MCSLALYIFQTPKTWSPIRSAQSLIFGSTSQEGYGHITNLAHRKLGGQQQSNTLWKHSECKATDLTNSFKITELKIWVFTSSQTPGHLAVWRTATEFLCHLSAAELTVVPLATTHHVARSIDPLLLLPPCFPFQSPDCNPTICDKLINNDKQHSLE